MEGFFFSKATVKRIFGEFKLESGQFKKFISKISGQKHAYNLAELNN